MTLDLSADTILPTDHGRAILIGRAWLPGQPGGPSVVTLREGQVIDLSRVAATIADVVNAEDPVGLVRGAAGTPVGAIDAILANSRHTARDAGTPYMLPPVDLQAVKAAGVTFVESLLERVIEEQAKGDPAAAEEIRGRIQGEIGVDLTAIKPASPEAMNLKDILVARGMWSAYLEVGIGPDAEVFTKAQPMSAVGVGAEIGLHPSSTWNNPEPELVLVIDARGRIVGVTLGNDVNLRDVEGRSALLLGRAKDNNGSTAIGPFVRLFDDDFTSTTPAPWKSLCVSKATMGSSWTGGVRWPRSRVTSATWRAKQLAQPINTPMVWYCSPALCSRRPRTAARPARGSPTSSAIG